MNTTAPARGPIDAADENLLENNSKTYDTFLPYRALDRTMFHTTPETSLMAQFKGANDVSIIDGNNSESKAGYDYSSGVQAHEEYKEQHGFRQNEDGSFTLKGDNGETYTIKLDDKTGAIAQVVDAKGNPITDKSTLEQITGTFRDIRDKDLAIKYMEDHPLETDKQKEAVDKLYEAMKAGDWKAMEEIAKQFNGNPKEFDAVFYHLFGAKVLSGMDDVNMLLFTSNDGNRYFLAGGEKPIIAVPISK